MSDNLLQLVQAFDLAVFGYFLSLNAIYLIFSIIAFFSLIDHRRRWTSQRLDVLMRSSATPGVSVIMPAHNEEATIEQSLRSMLLLNHPVFEVIVVNNGSNDQTIERLVSAFELIRAPAAYPQAITTGPVRAIYRALDYPELVVLDKVDPGKPDAINAGINGARYPSCA